MHSASVTSQRALRPLSEPLRWSPSQRTPLLLSSNPVTSDPLSEPLRWLQMYP